MRTADFGLRRQDIRDLQGYTALCKDQGPGSQHTYRQHHLDMMGEGSNC